MGWSWRAPPSLVFVFLLRRVSPVFQSRHFSSMWTTPAAPVSPPTAPGWVTAPPTGWPPSPCTRRTPLKVRSPAPSFSDQNCQTWETMWKNDSGKPQLQTRFYQISSFISLFVFNSGFSAPVLKTKKTTYTFFLFTFSALDAFSFLFTTKQNLKIFFFFTTTGLVWTVLQFSHLCTFLL